MYILVLFIRLNCVGIAGIRVSFSTTFNVGKVVVSEPLLAIPAQFMLVIVCRCNME